MLAWPRAGFAAPEPHLAAPEPRLATAEPRLGGRVLSPRGEPLEGVLVSVRKEGAAVTVTVVSDHDGRFALPADVGFGRYAVAVRAVGFALKSPASFVFSPATERMDIALAQTQDLAAQLSNTEWLTSMPGDFEQKRPLIECMSCHTLERIARSHYDATQLVPVIKRMAGYANNTTMQRIQRRAVPRKFDDAAVSKLAQYLASVNLSRGPSWSYPLKTLPRPQWRATRVVIHQYDLPRKSIAPHDVRVDADGRVWYSNFVENFLGRFDPRTGEHKEFDYPAVKPGFPTGALALEADGGGHLWLAPMFQSGLVEFDIKTSTFKIYRLPSNLSTDASQQSLVMPRQSQVDGKVWTNDVSTQAILRLDIATGGFESIDPFKFLAPASHSPYGMAVDAGNDLYFMDFGGESIGRVDAKTLRTTLYPIPTKRSRPRRCMMDAQGRIWFAEFAANKVALFDSQKDAFKEWDAPTPHTYPYDVFLDRNGELWSAGMASDRVLRLDPATGQSIEYLLPLQTNIRRIFIDDSARPVTFWAGSNHGASIVELTPLD